MSEHHLTTDNSASVILHFLPSVTATKLLCSQQDFNSIRNFNSTSSEAHSIHWTQITHTWHNIKHDRNTTHHKGKHPTFKTSARKEHERTTTSSLKTPIFYTTLTQSCFKYLTNRLFWEGMRRMTPLPGSVGPKFGAIT